MHTQQEQTRVDIVKPMKKTDHIILILLELCPKLRGKYLIF